MQNLIVFCFAVLILLSCKNDTTASKMAVDACSCFSPEADDLSNDTRKILVRVFRSNDWEQTMARELAEIKNDEDKSIIIQELETSFNRRSFRKCIEKVNDKYKNRRFDQKLAQELSEEMEDIDNCDLGAALMNYASRHELNIDTIEGNTNADAEEDTELEQLPAEEEEN